MGTPLPFTDRCAALALLVALASTSLVAAQQRPRPGGQAGPAEPLKLRIGVLTGLQYDLPRFEVEPGRKVEIVFHNEDEMAHNMLVVRPGSRERVALAAAMMLIDGAEKGYNPATDDVLHALPILEPGKSATLRFTAPGDEGIYPYVCTFPGHASVMYGAMYVGTPMPEALKDDENVSPLWRSGEVEKGKGGAIQAANARHEAHNRQFHAWSPERRPLIYRIFMPDASPAAIAVALGDGVNACFDATSCRLRYAWVGGFVDPWPVWKGNGNGLATVLGERFLVEDEPLLALGDAAPRFRGYRVVDGHPVFQYRVGDVGVRVRYGVVRDADGAPGLERRFEFDDLQQPLRLRPSSEATVRYEVVDAAGKVHAVGTPIPAVDAATLSVRTWPLAGAGHGRGQHGGDPHGHDPDRRVPAGSSGKGGVR